MLGLEKITCVTALNCFTQGSSGESQVVVPSRFGKSSKQYLFTRAVHMQHMSSTLRPANPAVEQASNGEEPTIVASPDLPTSRAPGVQDCSSPTPTLEAGSDCDDEALDLTGPHQPHVWNHRDGADLVECCNDLRKLPALLASFTDLQVRQALHAYSSPNAFCPDARDTAEDSDRERGFERWVVRSASISEPNTPIEVRFDAGTEVDMYVLRRRVAAMGIFVVPTNARLFPALPYGVTDGPAGQPYVRVTWAAGPKAESRINIHGHRIAKVIACKGKLAAFTNDRVRLMCASLGPFQQLRLY